MYIITRLARSLATGAMLACLFLVFTSTATATAPATEVKIARFDVGFGGKYRVGNWTPVRVALESDGVSLLPLSVIVPDGDGVPSRVVKTFRTHWDPQTVTLYVRFGRVHSDVTVTVGGPGADARSTDVYSEAFYRPDTEGPYLSAVSAEDSLIVIVGSKTEVIEEAIRATNQETASHTAAALVVDPDDLPNDWIGYDGVDTLILSLSDPNVSAMFAADDNDNRWAKARLAAIKQWVRRGGRLVLLGGKMAPEQVEKLVKSAYDPKDSLLPGKPVGVATLDHITPLEAYIDTHAAIPLPAGQRRQNVPGLELAEPQGTVLIRSRAVPLLVEKTYGFGMVTFLAIDPNAAPFDQWRDRGQMMAKLLGMPEKSIDMEMRSGGAVRHLGFTDLSGQMRSALDRFDGVTLVPFGLMIAIVLVYVLLIGPADYFLLKKIGRMSWTWVTFTLVVVLIGVGTLWLAYRMKGDQLHLHRVDLVDVDVTSGGVVRGTSWANLFSPAGTRYDLAFSCDSPDTIKSGYDKMLFSWLGLPGRGLGGMNPRAAEASVWRNPYDFVFHGHGCDQMNGVPILNWSTKSFTSRWSGEWQSDFAFTLREEDELPVGRVTNPLKGQSLEDCLLIYDRWAYKLGTLEPGESVRIDGIAGRMKLNTLLTGRKMVADVDDSKKMREQVTPYDTESVDPAYVLRMMMFYDVAGGQGYARLSNRYQPFVDLSDLLAPGRAMFVGRLPADAAAVTGFTVDDEPVEADQHMTVFRFIIPVEIEN